MPWTFRPSGAKAAPELTAPLAAALGAEPLEVLQAMDVMAVFASEAEVLALSPPIWPRWPTLETRGVIATAPGERGGFRVPLFCPPVGDSRRTP